MKKLLTLSLTTLILAACSTTNSNDLESDQVSITPTNDEVCFYTKRPGWKLKEMNCMSRKLYETKSMAFMPKQPSKPINVDILPNTGK